MIFEKIEENFKELKEGNKEFIKNGLIDEDEALKLFKIDNWRDYLKLFNIASKVRDFFKKEIEITSTIHITNVCHIILNAYTAVSPLELQKRDIISHLD